MIDCISVENMRLSDADTIANLIPSLELMYRAAYGVYLAHQWESPVAIVTGSGNNGGDGYALACILKEHDISCTVFSVTTKLSQDSEYYAGKATDKGIAIHPFETGCLKKFSTVVDCLLGTGFQGELRNPYRTAIQEINTCGSFVVSVDINSGMNGDSGNCEMAVHSDLTVTIGYVKTGLISKNAGNYIKRLVCTDIGIKLVKEESKICSAEEWKEKSGKDGFLLCPSWLDMNIIPVLSLDYNS